MLKKVSIGIVVGIAALVAFFALSPKPKPEPPQTVAKVTAPDADREERPAVVEVGLLPRGLVC